MNNPDRLPSLEVKFEEELTVKDENHPFVIPKLEVDPFTSNTGDHLTTNDIKMDTSIRVEDLKENPTVLLKTEYEDEAFFAEIYNHALSEASSVSDESDSDAALYDYDSETSRTGSSSSSDCEDFDADVYWTEFDPPRMKETFLAAPGVKSFPSDRESVSSVVSLLLPEEFFEIVVQETNRYQQQNGHKYRQTAKTTNWVDVTLQEMKRFFALSVLMGQIRKDGLSEYWSTHRLIETPIFAKTMTKNRFMQILTFLHFNNNVEIEENSGRLVKVQILVDLFINKFKSVYVPNQNLSVDEAMIPWKGKIQFKPYNPSKTDKNGILCRLLCESMTGYICNVNIYSGNAGKLEDTVSSLLSPFSNSWYHIYADSFFNSVNLAETLLERKFRICGPIRVNKDLPNSLKRAELGLKESVYCRKGEVLLQLWQERKKRAVCTISTIHNSEFATTRKRDRTTGNVVEKPKSVVEYDKNMKGIPRSDYYSALYFLFKETNKWSKRVVFFLCDCAIFNASIVFKELNPKTKMRYDNFLVTLAKEWLTVEESPDPIPGPSNVQRMMGAGHLDPPGRLSGNLRQHVLIKIISAKTKKPVRRTCRVCLVNKGRGDSAFMCKFCEVPLHRGECFDDYHTKKKY